MLVHQLLRSICRLGNQIVVISNLTSHAPTQTANTSVIPLKTAIGRVVESKANFHPISGKGEEQNSDNRHRQMLQAPSILIPPLNLKFLLWPQSPTSVPRYHPLSSLPHQIHLIPPPLPLGYILMQCIKGEWLKWK
jgi:hypothetical protein